MQPVTRTEGCVVAMDTSAEENHSREIDSSGEEEHEQDEVTEGTNLEEDLGLLMGDSTVDPEPFRCKTPYYSFTSASHQLMVCSIMAGTYATTAEIVEADPSFVEAMGLDKARRVAGVEGRWKMFQDRLHARLDGCGNHQLFFKTTPDKLIAHIGQWQEIVHTFHVDAQQMHFGASGTIDRTRQVWMTDTRRHGIPELFVQACISICPICNPTTARETLGNVPVFEGKRTRPPKFTFPVQVEVPVKALPEKLEALAIEHKVVLRMLHSKRIAPCPFLSEVVSYICHRGQFKRLREKKERFILEKRRCRSSFRCGCNFRIKTLIPITNYSSEMGSYDYQTEGTAVVLLNPVHVGHEPGSEADLLHLPVHPSAIQECDEDRRDMKDIHAITRSSLRRSLLLKAQASELEQATFRFFLTKKETQRLPYYRQSKEKLLKDMAKEIHSKSYEADSSTKVDHHCRPGDVSDKLSSIQGVQDTYLACMPARRLGFQKVLARLTDARQASASTEQLRVGQREAEASVYYSRRRQAGGSGRHSTRPNHSTQLRSIKEFEYPERYGRDSRLDLVNKGISQFNRLQLTEKMDADADVEKATKEGSHAIRQTLDGYIDEEFKHRAGDFSFDQMRCSISDLKCLQEALKLPGSIEQIDAMETPKRSSLGRQVRYHYMSTQPSHTSDSSRAGGSGEVGGHVSASPAQAPSPHSSTRGKKTVGRKRKRNSVFVHNLPVKKSPYSDCDCPD